MEYFMTFPWKMLQDISRGFQGNFYGGFLLHQRFTESCGKQGCLLLHLVPGHQFLLGNRGAWSTDCSDMVLRAIVSTNNRGF